jgi:hypothetical protein
MCPLCKTAGRRTAFTYDEVRKSEATAIAGRLVRRTGDESYGGQFHPLVNASIAEQADVLSKALKGRVASVAEWVAFNDSAPELARLVWEYVDTSYSEMVTKAERMNTTPARSGADAQLRALANSGDPGWREWAQRRLA